MIEFPTQQRVLTPEEYAALGYIQRADFDPTIFNISADKPLSTPLIDLPAYRAETQEEALIDIGVGLVKVGYAVSTGGLGAGVNTTLGYTWSLLT
jgi:hypothetical protein